MIDYGSFICGAVFVGLIAWYFRHCWAMKKYLKLLRQLPWNNGRRLVLKRIPPWYLLRGRDRGREYTRARSALDQHIADLDQYFVD